MDFYDLKNAFLVGVFMAFMIGPVFFMLLKTSVLKGARAAIAFDIGVILGDISFMLIAYFGSRSLLEQIKDDPRLFLIGGLVLVIYGLITYLDKNNKKEAEAPDVTLPESNNYIKLLLKGFFLNFINVGVLAFWLGLIVVIGPTYDMNPKYLFWYFGTVILGYALTDLAKGIQSIMIADLSNEQTVKAMAADVALNSVCLVLVFDDTSDISKYSGRIEGAMANTAKRAAKYEAFSAAMHGSVTRLPDFSACM